MPIAEIIGGILSAGASIIGGSLSVGAQKEANLMNLQLAEQHRRDTLRQRQTEKEMAMQGLSLSRRKLDIEEREAELSREERTEQRGYNRMQHAADHYQLYQP